MDTDAKINDVEGPETTDKSREGEERLFVDAFISYPSALVFPEISIVKKEPLGQELPDLCQFHVSNNSDFSYSVSLLNMPEWCLHTNAPMSIDPGQIAFFLLGIKSGILPPGKTIGHGEVVLKRPFIRRAYPIEMFVAVSHDIAIPRVKVEVLSREYRKLRVTIANGGSGILQGYCYDLASRTMQKFYLSSRREESQGGEQTEEAGGNNKSAKDNTGLVLEKTHQNCAGNRGGYLITSDCPNPRFRRIEIDPDDYLPKLPFCDKPVLHFIGIEVGKPVKIDLRILHSAFLNMCKIYIPSNLQSILHLVKNKAGYVCFQCKVDKEAGLERLYTGYVEFTGIEALQYKLPVAISLA